MLAEQLQHKRAMFRVRDGSSNTMAHKEINQIMTPSMEDHLSPVAQLHTLSFSKLLRRYRHEQARLLNAVESDGFFYLELTHTDSMELYKDYEQVLQIMKGWFDQPTETKTLFAYGSDVQGYVAPIITGRLPYSDAPDTRP